MDNLFMNERINNLLIGWNSCNLLKFSVIDNLFRGGFPIMYDAAQKGEGRDSDAQMYQLCGQTDTSGSEFENEGQQSKIPLPCWAVLPVFLSFCPVCGSRLSSCPVQKTSLKKRDMKCWLVAMCARSYSPVPLFLCLPRSRPALH